MQDESVQLPPGTLIADAGASKVDWALGEQSRKRRFQTRGINPFFHDEEDLLSILDEDGEAFGDKAWIRRVYFYGAGCSSEWHQQRVRNGLERSFTNAKVEVEHDLLGAARASAGDERALVAILGTGSNACSYDGERILEQSGGLGYVLGDEGSGADMGKRFLRDYLEDRLPKELTSAFKERFPQSREAHIEAIHRGKDPSSYLASLAPFLKEHIGSDWIRGFVSEAFEEFTERHLLSFDRAQGSVLHTVGSVGYHFRPVLEKILGAKGIVPGRSVVEPIEGLIEFHADR